MASSRAVLWASAAFLSLLVSGCQDATQVTIDLRTDALCAGNPDAEDVFDSAAFYITSGDALDAPVDAPFPDATTQPGQCSGGDPLSEIGTLGLIPGGRGSDASVGLRVLVGINGKTGQACADAGCDDAECIDIRRRVSFVPKQSLLLPITASRNCLGLCCDEGETCIDGACVGVEQPPCDPDLEVCDPAPPVPPIGQRWAFSMPSSPGLRIDASRARVAADGTLVVAIAGSYPGNSTNNAVVELAGRQLATGSVTGVFIARIEVPATGVPTVTDVDSCSGDDIRVRDLDYGDQGPTALLMASGSLTCGGGNGVPTLLGPSAIPLLWALSSATGLAAPILLQETQGGAPTADAQSVVFERAGATNIVATHLAGIHQLGIAAVMLGGILGSLPEHDSGYFYQLAFSATQSGVATPWFLGRDGQTKFAIAESHQLVQGAGAVWNIGAFEGEHEPLGAAVDVGGRTVFATPNGQLGPALVASGGIAIVNRARFLRGGTDVVVPVRLDPDVSPQLLHDGQVLPIAAASAAAIRFTLGGVGVNPTTTVPLIGAGGRHPFAAGFGDSMCLAYDRDGQGVLSCLDQPELSFGKEVELMGFDAARASPEGVGWLVMVGHATGDLGGGFPSFGRGDEQEALFVAGYRSE